MDYKDLANLIFPNAKPISYYEEKYPERNLPEGAMVVRFAPSPTGYVHIGGLYQSIICTTLAKQTKGVSILRIEDTDQKRLIENGVVQIVEAVKDFGIVFDEGMINETEKKDVRQRLKKVAGQINGIDKMVEEGRYCVDVVQQIVAARAALNKAAMLILESHAKSCVVKAIKEDNGEESIDELMQVL